MGRRRKAGLLGQQQSYIDGERYLRVLMLQSPAPQGLLLGSEALGERIADYIVTFDTALKLYFSQTEPEDRQMRSAVERLYLDYLGRQNIAV